MEINIGISADERKKVADKLCFLLADSYTLYLQTHQFHWNVTGPMFQTMHLMFEEQYTELALAVDQIAERIRALGHMAPGNYAAFAELSSIAASAMAPPAHEMIALSVSAQEAVVKTAREVLQVAEAANDQASADLATQRLQLHEKSAWMLRSMLAED